MAEKIMLFEDKTKMPKWPWGQKWCRHGLLMFLWPPRKKYRKIISCIIYPSTQSTYGWRLMESLWPEYRRFHITTAGGAQKMLALGQFVVFFLDLKNLVKSNLVFFKVEASKSNLELPNLAVGPRDFLQISGFSGILTCYHCHWANSPTWNTFGPWHVFTLWKKRAHDGWYT